MPARRVPTGRRIPRDVWRAWFAHALDVDHAAAVVVLSSCRVCSFDTTVNLGELRHDPAPDEMRRVAEWLQRNAPASWQLVMRRRAEFLSDG